MKDKAEILKENDVQKVLQVIAKSENPRRNRIIFFLTYLVGMKIKDIQKIVFSDVFDEDNKVLDTIVVKKKNGVDEYYLCDEIKQELASYYKWCQEVRYHIDNKDYLVWSQKTMKALHFGSIVRIFRKIYDAAGLKNCRSCSGRKSFAANLFKKELPIQEVSRLMNHKSINCTFLYYKEFHHKLSLEKC